MRISSVLNKLPKSCLICALSVIIYIYNIIRSGASCLLNLGRVVLGRHFRGASCLEASCLRERLSWGELSLERIVRNLF